MPLLFSMVFSRYSAILLIVLALGYSAYAFTHNRGMTAQLALDTPVIQQLTRERDEARTLVKNARDTAVNQATAHAEAMSELKSDNIKVLAVVVGKLDASHTRERIMKDKLNEVLPHYVSAKADALCVVPTGFVRIHNMSAQGRADPDSPAQGLAIPTSGPTDADRASGISLSTVARTVASNYNECESRRETLTAWQSWYTGSLAAWLKAVEAQSKFMVAGPPVVQ